MSFECHLYVMSFVCPLYVLVCHSHATRVYSHVIRVSLVHTRMSSYVTRVYLYVSRISLVCGFTMNLQRTVKYEIHRRALHLCQARFS